MNQLPSIIQAVVSTEHLSCVNVLVGSDIFSLLLAEKFESSQLVDKNVNLAFKETEIILSKELLTASANSASAVIKDISRGEVLTQVTLSYQSYEINALVPTSLFEPLHVSIEDSVYWMVQANEISLLWGTNGI